MEPPASNRRRSSQQTGCLKRYVSVVSTTTPSSPAAHTLSEPHIRLACLEDISPILTLHGEAFADKFGGAFGPKGLERGVAALEASWRRQGMAALRGMFVAEVDNQIVGTTTLRTWEMGTEDTGAAELAFQQVLGLWGAVRSMFALSLLDHRIGRGEGFITDVAVLTPYRRQGIARALLARAEHEARSRHKHYLGLYVSGANLGARTLYRTLGFRDMYVRRSWLTRFIFGQREWIYMRKHLT